ncbi:tetrahydrobiopterin biosynthesis enzymes-like protein [Coniophora puteana RWD-64-598 SS2]|uniref:dihydroneopterin aldolase n=1 Tax=Coniophora puteana (strain RWD-64-598) TaxID=741705 RepID=A0A5M3M6F3_CONPW|nr:tetrahydrobiopterin biosynthesis enzymes-like protein [Coniophora puteana RWD-64-598 SS2]EIW74942.1 tetrahydrobiopterin biosynthesis enzymes-like protein [Coniophora puteana RWD-64-598 SS2]
MATSTSPATDVVFIESLSLSATIGPDCWGRTRAQPILLSVHLHLRPSFLDKSGASDKVEDSVHYGHLTKVVSQLVAARENPSNASEQGFQSVHNLIGAVAQAAFGLAGAMAERVHVRVELPKLVLLAESCVFEADVSSASNLSSGADVGALTVHVKDVVLPVLIGVNPPERLAKQKVITNLTFYEHPSSPSDSEGTEEVDYTAIVKRVAEEIERSEYLTLEKFVMEVVRIACMASPRIARVTVRAQKPSALTFAHSSGVQITRDRSAFVG